MKTLFLTLAACLFLRLPAPAAVRTFTWDANPPEELVVNYQLYEQLGPGWTKIGESTTTTLDRDIAPGVHVYAVTAVNITGAESLRGEPVTWNEPTPGTPPTGLRVALQISTDLINWETVAEHTSTAPRLFARAVILTP